MKDKILYVALCLIVPLVWGVVSAKVFDLVQARRRKDSVTRSETEPEDMYHI